MLTEVTGQLSFWILLAGILVSLGSYKLITAQSAEQIKEIIKQSADQAKEITTKIDDFRLETKVEQGSVRSDLMHMNEKINRIEQDTAILRAQSTKFSEDIVKTQVKLEVIERQKHAIN